MRNPYGAASLSLSVALALCSSFILLYSGIAHGDDPPEVEWTKRLPHAVREQTESIEETPDKGFAVLSTRQLVRTDARGEVLWETAFETLNYILFAVRNTIQDGHIVGGTLYTSPQAAALIKLDSEGNILWERSMGEIGAAFGASVALNDGDYFIGGAISITEGRAPYLARMDNEGNLLWEETYRGEDAEVAISSIRETRDGGFIAVGPRERVEDRPDGPYLLKLDGNGGAIWERILLLEKGVTMDLPSVIREAEDGGYVLAGTLQRGAVNEGYLRTIDPDGNVVWTKTFPGYGLSVLLSVAVLQEGGAVATGFTQVPPGGGVDAYLVKVDSAGDQVWEKPFSAPDREIGVGVVSTKDGGYALSARATKTDGTDIGVLIKLAPEEAHPQPLLRRGDARGDGAIDISDAVFTFNYLFLGGSEPGCLDSSDTDDDGVIDISDGIGLLQFLFLTGEAPRPPGPDTCGPDPTPDELSCQSYISCQGRSG